MFVHATDTISLYTGRSLCIWIFLLFVQTCLGIHQHQQDIQKGLVDHAECERESSLYLKFQSPSDSKPNVGFLQTLICLCFFTLYR